MTIPNALHCCQACNQGVAEGLDMNGLPRICSDCVIERTLLAVAYRDLQRRDRSRRYEEARLEASGLGIILPEEDGA